MVRRAAQPAATPQAPRQKRHPVPRRPWSKEGHCGAVAGAARWCSTERYALVLKCQMPVTSRVKAAYASTRPPGFVCAFHVVRQPNRFVGVTPDPRYKPAENAANANAVSLGW